MRIRTIKPEFWSHEGLCACSEFTRLLAIALLNLADDYGYFMANPHIIRGSLFPFLDSSETIPGSIQDLSRVGWIETGVDDQGRSVGRIINFTKHQRVDKPKPSQIKPLWQFLDSSKTHPRRIQDASKGEWNGMGMGMGMEGMPPNPQGGMDAEELKLENQEPPKPKSILPAGWEKMTGAQRKQTRVNLNSPAMNRIGKMMGRREGTLWTVAEAIALKTVNPQPEEIALMETYYLADIDRDEDFRRRDLLTLLNNWNGELDRARIHQSNQ